MRTLRYGCSHLPVGKIVDHGREILLPAGMEQMGPVTQKLYDTLTGIQMGRLEAPEGWIQVIEINKLHKTGAVGK